ncbi:embryo defective 3006 [Striga hermonthica]|uniref:Embryo defective 3006 n=1 Tax=Striga hermonthica TaxID=68872 RepID=A0A9N7MPU2_STRHE|nr:embryo defective 3006 [Striga hermonthica]
MEKKESFPGSRQLNLKKSFNLGLRSLLNACSDEEFREAFPGFTAPERERLHGLFLQKMIMVTVISHLLQEEFESIFLQTQAGTVLDTVEELVEEHNLDPLISEKSNVGETAQILSEAKKNEIKDLTGLLEKAEEQKRKLEARYELLKKEKQDFSGATNLVDELRTRISNYNNDHLSELADI